MFFQALIYLAIVIGGGWAIWKFVVEPILLEKGMVEKADVKTNYTKKLDELKKQHEKISASSGAVEKSLKLSKQIKKMENKIADVDKKIAKKMKK